MLEPILPVIIIDPTGSLTLEPYGSNAWLLRFADQPGDQSFQFARAICGELDKQPPLGLIEYVPGYTSILIEFVANAPGATKAALEALLLHLAGKLNLPLTPGPLREIEVNYNGPDLARVAAYTELSPTEVIERHCAPEYRVDLIGFAPGFPYLNGLDSTLATPRLEQPRLRVEAGVVAIGGEHTGIYSVAGPGGWNQIGHTDAVLFDPITARCLLAPGDRLRFRPR